MCKTPRGSNLKEGDWFVVYSISTSGLDPFPTPQLFYTHFYNHARRLRLEKLLCLEASGSPNGFFKPLLDPDGGFTSETAERWF
jgi:hypothetical protein